MTNRQAVRRGAVAITGLAFLAAVACSRITGSGNVMTKSVEVGTFNKVEIGNAFEVNLSIGDKEDLTLHVDDSLMEHVIADVSGDTLRVRLEPGTSVRDATLKADVTARTLSSIALSGAAQAHLTGEVAGPAISVTASGASELEGVVRMDEVKVSLSGASTAKLSGDTARLVVTGSGASELDAVSLQSTDLEIALSGASEATVSVSGTVSAQVSGASTLSYKGSPRFTKRESSGASQIEPV